MEISICGVSRGRFIKPVPADQIKWVDEEDNPTTPPVKYGCEHPDHWKFGKGTRNGQKLYYPTNKMFWQKWHLTKKEMNEAIKCYDMFSIEMRGRIICKECAERIFQNY
jgi:hypothetical protein